MVIFDSEAYESARNAHHVGEKAVKNAFLNDLRSYLGINGNAKADKLIELADQYGRSGGFAGVLSWAEALVELIR